MKMKILWISKCVCGCKAKMTYMADRRWWVACTRGERSGEACWFGPTRKTAVDAIRAWNRVMAAVREAKMRGAL